ncbi:DUF6361 family protein [Methylocystis parvus]|uniref:Uncharacterized protein n=1 Tax=Methylocystis parvus TaxID=134 RepID=A0A6B8M4M2_9HYPH|nr:DUF6361 family protein [Methylocystis parvus]QGM99977.1 hypothetical protein F7D14_20570 [Methylocystis parvus]WBK02208.1 DUF6361 family protein [Methylocystis parvus OBBP]
MQASFGWTLLSRDALRRAEKQLRDAADGVRDEVGFLALHQAYADRFFPGTSVLHTRLRYVLFVPWLYEKVTQQRDRHHISAAVENQEIILARRLKKAKEFGVIGGRSLPKPTTQPPTLVYWSALSAWRILRPNASGTIPSRQTVHRIIARQAVRPQMHDDDRQLLVEDEALFYSVPKPPPAWHDHEQRLDFQLATGEKRFLRNCFLSVARPDSGGSPSLLARLVEHNVEVTDRLELWSPIVKAAADHADREALLRAKQAAALSAIGRGVYAALVETLREEHDGLPTDELHRKNLKDVCDKFANDALALDIDGVSFDATLIPGGILGVLRETQAWLRNQTKSLNGLYDVYQTAESHRKGRRARLTKSLAGREKRAEWLPDQHPLAAPLHYRWGNVRQLLMDLQETP